MWLRVVGLVLSGALTVFLTGFSVYLHNNYRGKEVYTLALTVLCFLVFLILLIWRTCKCGCCAMS